MPGDNHLEEQVDRTLSLVAQADSLPQPIIERSAKPTSQQPRFSPKYRIPAGYFIPYDIAEAKLPKYSAESGRRDKVLHNIWRLEPHLAGVMNAVNLIDSNRGWSITGGRNQVMRYTKMLHDADGDGWRQYMRKGSLSYWATDLGFVTELGREGRGGPVRALYHVDSTCCSLTAINPGGIRYITGSTNQEWTADDYFRTCSMPSDDERFHDLGYCAISRAIEITRIMYAVMVHDQEEVGARAPRGLLLLENISEDQWEQSLATREEKLDSLEYRYYAGVQVLASSGMGTPKATLIALSQLPANFDARTFQDLCMFAYSLCFGFDPSEFWPVQFGAMGRGTETEVQHMKATGKGGTDFALTYQEQLQKVLPDTLQFEFSQRDDQGELQEEAVKQAKLTTIATGYQTGLMQGAPLISRDEARSMMADAQLIPTEWADTEDDSSQSTDTEAERMLDTVNVRRAIAVFKNEPIIRVHWPSNRMQVLFNPYDRRRIYAKPGIKRQEDEPEVLYQNDKLGFKITQDDVDLAIVEAADRVSKEFGQVLLATPYKETE